jgi:hypothetical protein
MYITGTHRVITFATFVLGAVMVVLAGHNGQKKQKSKTQKNISKN